MLVARGSTWRYWDRDREPPNASGSWKNPGYNDSTWPSDNARFVFNEFLVLPGWTVLANVPERITCYFRKTFNVLIRPSGTPTLKLLCDDATAVYLNGVEVWRQNLPGGTINHTTRALTSVQGRDENAFNILPLPDAAIRLGTNTLAIEVHDRSSSPRGGSDVSFDAELALLQTPSLVVFSDRPTPEDTTLSFSFTRPADSETPGGEIEMSARSSNQSLVLDADIKFGFDNFFIPPRRILVITPRANAAGQTEITVIASDGSSETWQKFLLTVTPVNDAPTMQPIPGMTTTLGEIPAATPVTVADIDSPLASLAVNATSSNQSLLPNSGLTVLPGDTPDRRWLRFTPTPGIAAQSTVCVVVSDGQLSTTNSFIFRVSLPLSVTTVPARLVQSGRPHLAHRPQPARLRQREPRHGHPIHTVARHHLLPALVQPPRPVPNHPVELPPAARRRRGGVSQRPANPPEQPAARNHHALDPRRQRRRWRGEGNVGELQPYQPFRAASRAQRHRRRSPPSRHAHDLPAGRPQL